MWWFVWMPGPQTLHHGEALHQELVNQDYMTFQAFELDLPWAKVLHPPYIYIYYIYIHIHKYNTCILDVCMYNIHSMSYSHPLKNLRPRLVEVHENEHCRTGLKTRNFVLMRRSNHRHQCAGIPGGMCIPHPPFNSPTFCKNAVETIHSPHLWRMQKTKNSVEFVELSTCFNSISQHQQTSLWGGHRPHDLCLSLRRFAPRRFRWSLRCPNPKGWSCGYGDLNM